jgi:hypothetical protein
MTDVLSVAIYAVFGAMIGKTIAEAITVDSIGLPFRNWVVNKGYPMPSAQLDVASEPDVAAQGYYGDIDETIGMGIPLVGPARWRWLAALVTCYFCMAFWSAGFSLWAVAVAFDAHLSPMQVILVALVSAGIARHLSPKQRG